MGPRFIIAMALFCCFGGALLAAPPPLVTRRIALTASPDDFVLDRKLGQFVIAAGLEVVFVDPESASVVRTIKITDRANLVAVSDDDQYFYLYVQSKTILRRYRMDDGTLDAQVLVNLGADLNKLRPTGLAVLPGKPRSVLLGFVGGGQATGELLLFGDIRDLNSPPVVLPVPITSLYVRPTDGAIFAWGAREFLAIEVADGALRVVRSTRATFRTEGRVGWTPAFSCDSDGRVLDLESQLVVGRAGYAATDLVHSPVGFNSTGTDLILVRQDFANQVSVVRYPLKGLRPVASASLSSVEAYSFAPGSQSRSMLPFGSDGMAVGSDYSLVVFHTRDLATIAPAEAKPIVDERGVVHVPLRANSLSFDSTRNALWAAIPGSVPDYGNTVSAIDPLSGRLIKAVDTGSEPSQIALSGDSSHLFVALQGAPAVESLDLVKETRAQRIYAAESPAWEPASVQGIPGTGDSVAVAWIASRAVYSSQVTVYDGGVPRPKSFANFKGEAEKRDTTLPFIDGLVASESVDHLYGATIALNVGNYRHQLHWLAIDKEGVRLEEILNTLLFRTCESFSLGCTPITVGAGHLFSGGGEKWTLDAHVLEGTFAVRPDYSYNAIPVSFADRGQVAYVVEGGEPVVTLTLFDVDTQLPLATMPIARGAGQIRAAVRVGDDRIAVAVGDEIQLIKLSSIPPWPEYSQEMRQIAPGLRRLSLRVNEMSGLPGTSNLLVTLPSTDGSIGNRMAVVSTDSGRIERSVFVGSEPTLLRVARDGSAAYTYLSGGVRVAQVLLASMTRSRVFNADPIGDGTQAFVWDMAVGPDGSLTTSFDGGWVATFENGMRRPVVDQNTRGLAAYVGIRCKIQLNDQGTVAYLNQVGDSAAVFRRVGIDADGAHFLSSTNQLVVGGPYATAAGLLYDGGSGNVIDAERSRVVGKMNLESQGSALVVPDLTKGRVYTMSRDRITIFDSRTYDRLGTWTVPIYGFQAKDFVRYGENGLAFSGEDGNLYFLDIGSIPLLAKPVPTPQPQSPSTPGVDVKTVDVAVRDLAYDASRDLIYASVPNSEAAVGDQVIAIEPASGKVVGGFKTGVNPSLLALSNDNSQLFFAMGSEPNIYFNGFSFVSESIRRLNLASRTVETEITLPGQGDNRSLSVIHMVPLPKSPQSLVVVPNLRENSRLGAETINQNLGPLTVSIYDNNIQRPAIFRPTGPICNSMTPNSTTSQLYCDAFNNGPWLDRLEVREDGVHFLDATPLLGTGVPGFFGDAVYIDGKLVTSTGLVIDAEQRKIVRTLRATGSLAIDGERLHVLDQIVSNYTGVTSVDQTTVALLTYDARTLEPIETRLLNVRPGTPTRLLPCGKGRLAFGVGKSVYIVNPNQYPQGSPSISLVAPIGSTIPAIQAGSWISIYGQNLANTTAFWQGNFPTTLAGVTVLINGTAAYIQYVSPTQINVQAPDDAAKGLVNVTVNSPTGEARSSVVLSTEGPSFARFDERYLAGVIPTADGSGAYGGGTYDLVGPIGRFPFSARPARPGEIVELYGVGFGQTYYPVPAGKTFSGESPSTSYIVVTIGGVPANILFSGITQAGLFQFNVVVPNVGTGDQSVQAVINGNVAPIGFIAVRK